MEPEPSALLPVLPFSASPSTSLRAAESVLRHLARLIDTWPPRYVIPRCSPAAVSRRPRYRVLREHPRQIRNRQLRHSSGWRRLTLIRLQSARTDSSVAACVPADTE